MKCPACDGEFAGTPNYCGSCGHNLNAAAAVLPDDAGLKLPTGFSRTLSTDLVAKQIERRTQTKLAALVENRTYRPGEVMIHQGEPSRDLMFLTEGVVEISRSSGRDGEIVLNEIEPPYILGDVAFLFGMPRTATARAKTDVRVFVVRYDELKDMLKELPPWAHPLLTALASDMKTLHHKSQTLEKRVSEIEAQAKAKS